MSIFKSRLLFFIWPVQSNNCSIFDPQRLKFLTRLPGAQPEILQDKGDFVELGHFDKPFVKNTRKKNPQGKLLELFLLDTFKATFWVKHLTQGWKQLKSFFKIRALFSIFKKGLRRPLPPPLVRACLRLGFSHLNENRFRHNFKDYKNCLCSCSLEI